MRTFYVIRRSVALVLISIVASAHAQCENYFLRFETENLDWANRYLSSQDVQLRTEAAAVKASLPQTLQQLRNEADALMHLEPASAAQSLTQLENELKDAESAGGFGEEARVRYLMCVARARSESTSWASARKANNVRRAVAVVIETPSGCKLRRMEAWPAEVGTRWIGACLDGFASGLGTLILSAPGVPTVEDNGTMERGLQVGEWIEDRLYASQSGGPSTSYIYSVLVSYEAGKPTTEKLYRLPPNAPKDVNDAITRFYLPESDNPTLTSASTQSTQTAQPTSSSAKTPQASPPASTQSAQTAQPTWLTGAKLQQKGRALSF